MRPEFRRTEQRPVLSLQKPAVVGIVLSAGPGRYALLLPLVPLFLMAFSFGLSPFLSADDLDR